MRILRFSPLAEHDIDDILAHSEAAFGGTARTRYAALITAALRHIAGDPDRIGVKRRDELGKGYRSYHLQYSRGRGATQYGLVRRPRHLILFRLAAPDTVDVARVWHDAMDIARHLPPDAYL